MPGKIYNLLAELALDQHGYVTTRDAEAHGVDPHRLVEMARRGVIERTERGIYRFPVSDPTGIEQYLEATLWPEGRGVISHDTALDLYDICDINPAKVHITVPARYRIRREIPDLYVVHRRDLDDDDLTLREGIRIVTPKRAILDGLESHVRPDLLGQALYNAGRRALIRREDYAELSKVIEPRDRT